MRIEDDFCNERVFWTLAIPRGGWNADFKFGVSTGSMIVPVAGMECNARARMLSMANSFSVPATIYVVCRYLTDSRHPPLASHRSPCSPSPVKVELECPWTMGRKVSYKMSIPNTSSHMVWDSSRYWPPAAIKFAWSWRCLVLSSLARLRKSHREGHMSCLMRLRTPLVQCTLRLESTDLEDPRAHEENPPNT